MDGEEEVGEVMLSVMSGATLGPLRRTTGWRRKGGVMTRGQKRMTQVERSQNIGENKHHLHRQCLSLRAKRTFHAVLLPVTQTASSKGQWSKEVWGAITSAGFSHKL